MPICEPKISIIIPCYNVEPYIGKAIQSILAQSYKNLELIVVNDGSTDNTLAEIKKHSNESVIIISQKNSGVSTARNKGIEAATGEWCAFLDADDWIEPYLIQGLVADACSNGVDFYNHDALIACNCKFVDENGKRHVNRVTAANDDVVNCNITAKEALKEIGSSKYILQSVWCKLFSLDVIRNKNIRFNETLPNGEDGLFVFNYLNKVNQFCYSSCDGWSILQREGSFTRSKFNPKLNSGITSVELMIQENNDPELDKSLYGYLIERTVSIECRYVMSDMHDKKLMQYYRTIIRENKAVWNSKDVPTKKKALYIIMGYFPRGFIRMVLSKKD